jgi:hypothetical protein
MACGCGLCCYICLGCFLCTDISVIISALASIYDLCYNCSYVLVGLGGLLVLLNLGLYRLIIHIYDLCYNCSYVLVGLGGLLVLLNLGLGGL